MPRCLTMCLATSLVLAPGRAAFADATVRVGSLSADGLEVKDLSCKLKAGGLFAGLMVVGALAKSKKALDACAPQGAAFATDVVFAGGKIASAQVKASSDPAKSACVSRVLEKTRTDLGGTCSLVLLVGKPDRARQAAAALKAKGGDAKAEGAEAAKDSP